MAKQGYSREDMFGGLTHYDKNGKKIGRSDPNILGGYTNYDAKGKKIGRSDEGIFGGYTHYDNRGRKTGSSREDMFGGLTHYDAKGKKIGSSNPGPLGGYSHSSGEGCYIATCVYGSYDCPQVWTLRRFRDETLKKSFFGKQFVAVYYALSPGLVRRFGSSKVFRTFCKKRLDRFVSALRQKGFADTFYEDHVREKSANNNDA